MDYTQAFAISSAGMTLERTRVDIAALNLANANTVHAADGSGYRPLRVVAQSGIASAMFGQLVDGGLAAQDVSGMLPIAQVMPSAIPARTSYEPGHPMADSRGLVAYSGVDTATEMVTLMTATRAYEANVAAMNTARSIALKALDIGGRS